MGKAQCSRGSHVLASKTCLCWFFQIIAHFGIAMCEQWETICLCCCDSLASEMVRWYRNSERSAFGFGQPSLSGLKAPSTSQEHCPNNYYDPDTSMTRIVDESCRDLNYRTNSCSVQSSVRQMSGIRHGFSQSQLSCIAPLIRGASYSCTLVQIQKYRVRGHLTL